MISRIPMEEISPLISEILKLNGTATFTVSGVSMQPMLYNKRDTVTLVLPPIKLKKYDLPFYQMDDGRFILHRVIKINKDGTYECRGDNRWESEDNIRLDQIIGVVSQFTRNGKTINVDKSLGYKLYCHIWQPLHHLKRYYKYITLAKKKVEDIYMFIRDEIRPNKIKIILGDNNLKDVVFRKGRKSDIKDIQTLSAELIDYESEKFNINTINKYWYLQETGKKYFNNLQEKSFLWVVTCDKKIIGYISGKINYSDAYNFPIGNLTNLYIIPEYRGYGIGTKLIDLFKDYCKKNRCNNITVTFFEKNVAAEKFYIKHGFGQQSKTYFCSFEDN